VPGSQPSRPTPTPTMAGGLTAGVIGDDGCHLSRQSPGPAAFLLLAGSLTLVTARRRSQ
jgi:hypothetical protein